MPADRRLAHARAALERSADSHERAARLHEEAARLDDETGYRVAAAAHGKRARDSRRAAASDRRNRD